MSKLKTFIASYYWSGRCQAFESIESVIVAETKQVALGLALENNPDTKAKHWTIEELDTSTVGYTEVSYNEDF